MIDIIFFILSTFHIILFFVFFNNLLADSFILQYLTGLLIGILICKIISDYHINKRDTTIKILLNDSAKETFIILILYLLIFNDDESMKNDILNKINQLYEINNDKLNTFEKINEFLDKVSNNEINFNLIEKNGKIIYQIEEKLNK